MKKYEKYKIDPRIWVLLALILAVSVSMISLGEAKEPKKMELLREYGYYPPEQDKDSTQVSFMNRSMMSPSSLTVPGNFRPPQCPYETYEKGLNLPLVGNLDVKLFCVPRDQDKKAPDEKIRDK